MANVAVIGLGKFGFHVAKQLDRLGHEVLAIDIDAANVQRIKDWSSRAVVLDALDKERLDALGITDFDTVVVSLGERIDASALITLHLKEVGIRNVVAKAGSEDHAKLLKLIGADEIVQPECEVAELLARRIGRRNLLDHIPLSEGFSIQEVRVPSSFVGKTLEETRVRNRFGIQVIAIHPAGGGALQPNPAPQRALAEGDVLVVLGDNEALARFVEV